MENFKFRKDGRLVIDAIYYDEQYPTKFFVVIDKKTYTMPRNAHYYQTGEQVAAVLKPVPERFTLNPTLEMRADFYLCFPCSPKFNKFKSRAAKKKEVESLKDKFDINAISQPFSEIHTSMYGDGNPKEQRYVEVKSVDAEKIEMYFIERHISCLTLPPESENGIDTVKIEIDY